MQAAHEKLNLHHRFRYPNDVGQVCGPYLEHAPWLGSMKANLEFGRQVLLEDDEMYNENKRSSKTNAVEVVSSSAEFESIPIRRHEDTLLRRIYDRVPVKLDRVDFEAPHFYCCKHTFRDFSSLS